MVDWNVEIINLLALIQNQAPVLTGNLHDTGFNDKPIINGNVIDIILGEHTYAYVGDYKNGRLYNMKTIVPHQTYIRQVNNRTHFVEDGIRIWARQLEAKHNV